MASTGPKTLETAELPYITGVIYGKSGAGKTALASSSQHLRTFVFDVDAGIYTARTLGRTVHSNVHYATIRSSDEFVEAFEWLKKHAGHYQRWLQTQPDQLTEGNCRWGKQKIVAKDLRFRELRHSHATMLLKQGVHPKCSSVVPENAFASLT